MPDVQHCRHFGRCGGCDRLDQPIEDQLDDKRRQAQELLAPWLDGIEPVVALPPRTPRHDRTALLYPTQRRGRRPVLGIYRRGTHDVEEITDCRIQHKALTRFGARMGEALHELDAPVFDEADGTGVVRAIRARIMPGTNELLVGAVVTKAAFPGRDRLVAAMRDAGSDLKDDQGRPVELVGVCLNVNERPGNALLGPETLPVIGRAWQRDRVAELAFRVSFTSFYQLNRHADAILFRPALALLGDVTGLSVVDGYAGVGTFALRLLRAGARHVVLVESSRPACDDARYNLAKNELVDRAEVKEQAFGSAPLPACDVLVADPPRAGLLEQGAQAILAAAPPRVLLVSCALASLARDLEAVAAGYRVVAVRLCDLFPHTEHVETLTLLERKV